MALEKTGEKTGTGVSAAERTAAEDLYLASMLATSLDHRERRLQAMNLLLGDRKFSTEPGWAELFDGLSPDDAARLRDLYDALPDGDRAEYDRRYQPPARAE